MNKDSKIKKILDNMEITRAINNAKLENAKFNLKEKEIFKQIDDLNREAKRDKKIKFSGTMLYLLSILGLIASTSLSISSGLNMYPEHKIAFIITIIFVQLVIFKVSTNTTIIKQSFRNHYTKVKLMQFGLLAVIIFYNYNFFYLYIADKGILLKIITFVLCFLMDYSTMQFVSLAFDQKHLNYSQSEIKESNNLISMLIFNLMYKTRINALRQYKSNLREYKSVIETKEPAIITVKTDEHEVENVIVKVVDENQEIKLIEEPKVDDPEPEVEDLEQEVEQKQSFKFKAKPLDIENIRKYLNYLLENSKDDVAIGYKKVGEQLGLSQGEAIRIYKKLRKKKYLITEGMKTKINKRDFNEDDFIGDQEINSDKTMSQYAVTDQSNTY